MNSFAPLTFEVSGEILTRRARFTRRIGLVTIARCRALNVTLTPWWPDPFPGYMGIFTYEVDPCRTNSDLGQGVFLWQFEILPLTFSFLGPPTRRGRGWGIKVASITCAVRKTLVECPEDACDGIQDWKGKFITEQWEGEAHVEKRAFSLLKKGDEPLENKFDFEGMPLDRDALAGQFQVNHPLFYERRV